MQSTGTDNILSIARDGDLPCRVKRGKVKKFGTILHFPAKSAMHAEQKNEAHYR
jgi:hypothetical protein